MLAVSTVLPRTATCRAPVVLIHGAANSARVWSLWQQMLVRRGWPAHALDLRGHGQGADANLATTTMADYAADVHTLIHELARPPILIGWSMGGLVALMVAAAENVVGCVGLAPSLPANQVDSSVVLRQGIFGPEEYDIVSRDPERAS